MPATPDPNPSEKQLETLTFIIAHVMTHGYQPSQQEMAEHFGVSKGAINGRLKELARRGLIELSDGKVERAIIIPFVEFDVVASKDKKPPAGKLDANMTKLAKNVVFKLKTTT